MGGVALALGSDGFGPTQAFCSRGKSQAPRPEGRLRLGVQQDPLWAKRGRCSILLGTVHRCTGGPQGPADERVLILLQCSLNEGRNHCGEKGHKLWPQCGHNYQ
jgi:hypothetical protein